MGVTDRMVEEEELCADWRRELMTDTAVYTNGPETVRKMKLGGGLRTWMGYENFDIYNLERVALTGIKLFFLSETHLQFDRAVELSSENLSHVCFCERH